MSSADPHIVGHHVGASTDPQEPRDQCPALKSGQKRPLGKQAIIQNDSKPSHKRASTNEIDLDRTCKRPQYGTPSLEHSSQADESDVQLLEGFVSDCQDALGYPSHASSPELLDRVNSEADHSENCSNDNAESYLASQASCVSQLLPAAQPNHLTPELIDMVKVIHDSEAQLQVNANYLDNHGPDRNPNTFVDAGMRKSVVSWVVEVATEFGFHTETMHLAISLLDRFLTITKAVPRTKLQLVAVACVMVAAKHEEEKYPCVADYVSIADNSFKVDDLLRMESLVLSCIGFKVNGPTSYSFLTIIRQAVDLRAHELALASFYIDLALLEYDLLNTPPSQIAAAAVALSVIHTGSQQAKTQIACLKQLLPHGTNSLGPVMERLRDLHAEALTSTDVNDACIPVRDKYVSDLTLMKSSALSFKQ